MKKENIYIIFVVAFLILLIFSKGQAQQTQQSDLQINEVLNFSDEKVKSTRTVYVLLAEKDFTLNNLKYLFKVLADKYSSTQILTIKVFSDNEILKKNAQFDNLGFSISFDSTEDGRNAEELFYQKYLPKLKGYSSEYYRNSNSEYFIYTIKKDDSSFVCVTIKESPEK